MELSREQLLWMYERMQLIRGFENRVKLEFGKGKIPGFVHLYAGEEAVAVGICANLTDRDYMTSTHRGRGHCLAKGVEPRGMMAELFGKATGTCKGKGGSMHIADMDKGMLGANGIVGGGPPLACGSGLTAKINTTDQVTICFFGDGASEQGTLHESLNLAAIWKLPVVFVAENNGYAESTPAHYHCSVENIADRAAAYNMPGLSIDGNDIFAVHEATSQAVVREGPTLLECKTYRFYGHYEGDSRPTKSPRKTKNIRPRRTRSPSLRTGLCPVSSPPKTNSRPLTNRSRSASKTPSGLPKTARFQMSRKPLPTCMSITNKRPAVGPLATSRSTLSCRRG